MSKDEPGLFTSSLLDNTDTLDTDTLGISAPDLVITAEEQQPLTVDLVGVRYTVLPPKGALALELVKKVRTGGDDPLEQVDAILGYLRLALGKKATRAIEQRLQDPDDLLDLKHLIALLEALVKRATGNPTG